MNILGISAFYHDSAAAIITDGKIAAAAQEERFSRKKGDSGFPQRAVEFCLKQANISVDQLEAVVYYDKPLVTFERLIMSYLHRAPHGFFSFFRSIPVWIKRKLWIEDIIRKKIPGEYTILFSRHHHSHAASAFFPSPFKSAAIVTLDGVGEWETTTIGRGRGSSLELTRAIHFPHSLGLLYSSFTYYCGFRVNSGEYKLMGLAPYGKPKYVQLIKDHLIRLEEDGSFNLNERYFNYISGLRMINTRFEKLFNRAARKPETNPDQFYMDVAASIQKVTEDAVIGIARQAKAISGEDNLVLAGGVALNSVANYRILKEGGFSNVWIQPAAGDAGGALGAALYAWNMYYKKPRAIPSELSSSEYGWHDLMEGALLGPDFTDSEIEESLKKQQLFYEKLTDSQLYDRAADSLSNGKVLGWFQGRMEYGPRALGSRSILADPRQSEMQKTLNFKIKFREGFRPFAPVVLAEKQQEWFDLQQVSPYMLMVAPVSEIKRVGSTGRHQKESGFSSLREKRSEIPSVTHVDYSARLQSVHRKLHGKLYELLQCFDRKTGCPVLINTSFNVRGEPIVNSPDDAIRCFLGTHMDALAIGNYYVSKSRQNLDKTTLDDLLEGWRQGHVYD